MIVILEGADNSGKSTLAKKLGQGLKIDVVHPGGPPKNIIEVIARCEEQSAVFDLSTDVNIIFDRVTCISDLIYRGRPEYNKIFKCFHKQLMTAENVVVIYCRPSDNRLKNFDDHIQQDHEDAAVVQHAKDNVDRIISGYDSWFKYFADSTCLNIVKYDFELDKSLSGYSALLKHLQNRKDHV